MLRANSMSMCRMISVFVIFTISYIVSIVDVPDNTNNRWLDDAHSPILYDHIPTLPTYL